jgi:hypothetical protein
MHWVLITWHIQESSGVASKLIYINGHLVSSPVLNYAYYECVNRLYHHLLQPPIPLIFSIVLPARSLRREFRQRKSALNLASSIHTLEVAANCDILKHAGGHTPEPYRHVS